jgi:hypothetical protein
MSAHVQTTIDESTAGALINYDAEFAKIAEETKNALTATKGNFISNKGKLFTFPDASTKSNFDCVIVDYIRVNTLMSPYNPNIRPVTKCWAMGRDDYLLTPSEKSSHRQADSCTACAMNKFGSATNGGRGKACTNTYRLAIIPPDATKESDIWLIKVSPTGLSAWTHYVRMAEATYGPGGFCRVITNLSFDPNKDHPSIRFKGVAPVEHPEIVLTLRSRARDEILIEPSGE